jgi:putative ubiquitin-RnfH superfamily antitoxin RatB of RatAB toxin-antitoxin module
MKVEVVYASKIKQYHKLLDVPENTTVQQTIETSNILSECPEINLAENTLGIFSQKVSLSTLLKPGDRIEIYRPLIIHPMQKRRRLASIQKKARDEKV